MSEWKECKLGEVAEITSSKRIYYSEYVDNGVPFFRSKEIIERFNKQNTSTELFIKRQRYEEIKLKFGAPQEGDILLTSVGTLGIPYLVRKEDEFYFKDGNLTWFRNIDSKAIDRRFLYFWITSVVGQQQLYEASIGSTQPALTIVGLKNIDILLPSLSEQRAIAGVLSSLDDKIALLHRQNKTMEAMAETIFRQWFLEGEKNSATVCLNDYVNCINGVSYKSAELNPSKNALVTLKSFNRYGGFSTEGFKEFTGKYKPQQTVFEGDLVVAHTDITQEADVLGNPALIISSPRYETLVISMDLVKVVPKVDWLSKEFLYFLMRSREFKYHCLGCANGTTVLHLSKEAIPTYEFSTPDRNKVTEFSKYVKELIHQIFIKNKQIHTLVQLRDTLLPKLMSGEVRVKV